MSQYRRKRENFSSFESVHYNKSAIQKPELLTTQFFDDIEYILIEICEWEDRISFCWANKKQYEDYLTLVHF